MHRIFEGKKVVLVGVPGAGTYAPLAGHACCHTEAHAKLAVAPCAESCHSTACTHCHATRAMARSLSMCHGCASAARLPVHCQAWRSCAGAFLPTCSLKHLPEYINAAESMWRRGVDLIACCSANDAFVMDAWCGTRLALRCPVAEVVCLIICACELEP